MRSPLTFALAATVLVGALASPAAAQLGSMDLGLGGGPSFPAQRFNDEGDSGYHLQGSLGLQAPLLPVGLRADVLWQSFPDDLEGDFRQLAGFISATAALPSPVIRPYGIAGLGYVRHDVPDVDHGDHVHGGGDDNDVGFQVGAGLRLGLLGLSGFVEARYMDMGEDYAAVPITVGFLF